MKLWRTMLLMVARNIQVSFAVFSRKWGVITLGTVDDRVSRGVK